jgi:hypothetical protein
VSANDLQYSAYFHIRSDREYGGLIFVLCSLIFVIANNFDIRLTFTFISVIANMLLYSSYFHYYFSDSEYRNNNGL